MNIGIACVYYYEDASDWMLRLQLEQILKNTAHYGFKVFAGAARLDGSLRYLLDREPFVEITQLPEFSGTGNEEHAFFLDYLIQKAFDAGCTHICTLDSDSFPIRPDWPSYLVAALDRHQAGFAAVHRTENNDRYLPHPCGYFMTRGFFQRARPRLLPGGAARIVPEMASFITATQQRPDTGIGYGWYLWEHREPWLRLERSNRTDFHFLIAGIYGNTFFHFGATSRAPLFSRDAKRPALKLAHHMARFPVLWRLSSIIERRHITRVNEVIRYVRDCLISDPEGFFSRIQGDSGPVDDVVRIERPGPI